MPNMPCPTEDAEQRVFVQWLQSQKIPHFRVPNETYTNSWAQKNKNKALGVVPGVPDLFVALPHKGLIAIEMKRLRGGTVSPAQKQWKATLDTIPGVEAHVAKGADAAIAIIKSFL